MWSQSHCGQTLHPNCVSTLEQIFNKKKTRQYFSDRAAADRLLDLWGCCYEVLLRQCCSEGHKSLKEHNTPEPVWLSYAKDKSRLWFSAAGKKTIHLYIKGQKCNNSGVELWLYIVRLIIQGGNIPAELWVLCYTEGRGVGQDRRTSSMEK